MTKKTDIEFKPGQLWGCQNANFASFILLVAECHDLEFIERRDLWHEQQPYHIWQWHTNASLFSEHKIVQITFRVFNAASLLYNNNVAAGWQLLEDV